VRGAALLKECQCKKKNNKNEQQCEKSSAKRSDNTKRATMQKEQEQQCEKSNTRIVTIQKE
jgi:hypothetical protein